MEDKASYIPAMPAGVTIAAIAQELKLKPDTAKRRLWTIGIKPMYALGGRFGDCVYPLSALDAIKDMKRGRPKKDTEGKE